MKVKTFCFQFPDKPHLVFFPGEQFQGQIYVELLDAVKMREMKLKLDGRAWVEWSEEEDSDSRNEDGGRRYRSYKNKEVYLQQTISIFNKESSQNVAGDKDTPVLPAGTHCFPFSILLPQTLPSSFEGPFGGVRYYASCTMDRPWKSDNKTKTPFTVMAPYDLNVVPQANANVNRRASKTICCLCCKSGPISCIFDINRMGYVPGEMILIDGEVDNKSTRAVDSTNIALIQTVNYHAKTKTRAEERVVTDITRQSVPPGDSQTWHQEKLVIPPVPPSELIGCSIIHIEYSIRITIKPGGCASNLVVNVPIIIGSIPLRNHFQPSLPPQMPMATPSHGHPSTAYMPPGMQPGGNTAPTPYQQSSYAPAYMPPTDNNMGQPGMPPYMPPNMGSAAQASPPYMPPPGMYPEMPLPSYNACVFGEVSTRETDDGDDVMGPRSYAPIYPYYGGYGAPPSPAIDYKPSITGSQT